MEHKINMKTEYKGRIKINKTMELRNIVLQLLINKYKNEEVTLELAERIQKEARKIMEEDKESSLPDNLPSVDIF